MYTIKIDVDVQQSKQRSIIFNR